MIREMQFVRLIGPKASLSRMVRFLFDQQIIHLTKVESNPLLGLESVPLTSEEVEKNREIQKYLTELRGVMELLEIKIKEFPNNSFKQEFALFDPDEMHSLTTQIKNKLHQQQKYEEELELLPLYERKLRQIIPFLPDTSHLAGYATISLFVSQFYSGINQLLQHEILNLTNGEVEFASFDLDQETSVVLVITKTDYVRKVEDWLGEENIPQFELPQEVKAENPLLALKQIQDRVEKLPELLAEIRKDLAQIKETNEPRLYVWLKDLSRQASVYEVYECFGEMSTVFVIQGWIPKTCYSNFEAMIREVFSEQVVLEVKQTPEDLINTIPVLVENNAVVTPFEKTVNLYAKPRYDDLDPSMLMTVFLPLFFGMILGDIGYGLILFGLTFFLWNKFTNPFIKDLIKIIRLGSLWAIGFGFLYGELFGTLGETLGLHPLWLDRAKRESLIPLMIAVVGLGAAHICLGLILGVWRAWVKKDRTHLLERGGMLVGLIGLLIIVSILAKLIPQVFMLPAGSILVVGLVLLGFSFGKAGVIVGPIEFIGVIGNILSYIRIAAVGLSSVYLAKVANDLAGSLGSLLVGIIVAVLFHALNLVIGTFSPSIHSLRLMYVEFFRKFYQGGGTEYRPFGVIKNMG